MTYRSACARPQRRDANRDAVRPAAIARRALLFASLLFPGVNAFADDKDIEEIVVIGVTPTEGLGLDQSKVAANVQSAGADDLARSQSLDLTDYMSRALGSVNINSAQNNPLQPDVQFRGFTASPLLGLPQGIAVYQDGARINEPFGDAVNWDLVPESAVDDITLIGGANPLFGLNSLGGALVIDMKNGFSFQGVDGEASGGSWNRISADAEAGGNNGTFGYYLNVQRFQEDGWRDFSGASYATTGYGSLSWHPESSTLDVATLIGDTQLNGTGPLPIGYIGVDRGANFTAPDITQNKLAMVTVEGTHFFSDDLQAAASGFYRRLDTDSFNSDTSNYVVCPLGNGTRLLQGLEEDELAPLGLDQAQVCDGATYANAAALETFLNGLAGGDVFHIGDVTGELSGTGVLTDQAINNVSTRHQQSYGGDVQLTSVRRVFERENHLVAGMGYFDGGTDFDSRVELSYMDPVTRSTGGMGVGTFVDSEATSVKTVNRSWSAYLSDTFSITEALAVTAGGRYNSTEVDIRDRSGDRPELNGKHRYERFNPAVGVTYQALNELNVYASYAESSRAPTPTELSCNAEVFDLARQYAIARGQDPDTLQFECRLPNAFLADPPLQQVVTQSYEFGGRGALKGVNYRLGYFHTVNSDDIVFQTTGRNTGLFANVSRTKRQGVEAAVNGSAGPLAWFVNYSFIEATFDSPFAALSPNHPDANPDGEILVTAGDRIPGIPEHQLKIGGDWKLTDRFTTGANLVVNSNQVLRGDESNQLSPIRGYALVNLRASYRAFGHVEVFGRIDNVFNTRYENFGVLGDDPTAVLGPLTDPRPVFLGVGAPRAAWVGVRVGL